MNLLLEVKHTLFSANHLGEIGTYTERRGQWTG